MRMLSSPESRKKKILFAKIFKKEEKSKILKSRKMNSALHVYI